MSASAAAAQNFGEIGKFGKGGKGVGEFTLPSNNTVHAVGVDPTDNSVYVGDEPKQSENAKEEVTSEFRIQKFSSSGTPLASVGFRVESVGPEGGKPAGLEGIAVDPTLERVYALVVYEREEAEGEKRAKENEKLVKEGKSTLPPRIDGEEPAAGILYAFKTAPSGKVLVPVEGASAEGVLAGTTTLKAQSEATHSPTQSALLEPSGIAVDPVTHDVIIVGLEDQGEEALLAVAQRVKSDGTLGARWVDTGECFEGEGEGAPSCFQEAEQAVQAGEPKSPVVTATGRILVDTPSNEIWEIPKGFVSGEAPKPVVRFINPLQNLLRFPGVPTSSEGGALAFVHEEGEGAGEGRLYQAAEVSALPDEIDYPAVLAFKLPETGPATELGWTGGQKKIEHPGCAISGFSQPIVGAGKKEAIYVLDPNVPPGTVQETPSPHVTMFGPQGSECPTDSAEAPIATASGATVGTEGNPAHVGQKVVLSSKVRHANALSVTWDFGDGTTQEVKEPQFLTTKVEHAFTSIGTKTVKETIKTDSLAVPTISTEAKVVVAAANPVAQFSISANPTVNAAVKFTSTSIDENKSPLVKYVWKFGDGGEVTGTTNTVEHTYGASGKYTVTLVVTDALGLSGSTSHDFTVAPVSEEKTTTTPPPSPSPPPTTTTPGNNVLGVVVSKGNPAAALAGTSLSVTTSGGFPVKVSCPTGETTCAGSITLRTLNAVAAGKSKKKAVLTLASGAFSVVGGSAKSLTLHLSAAGRKLLARSHSLRARATLVAHDTTGGSHTTVVTVTLKSAKKH